MRRQDIDVELAECLIHAQFPQWAHLPVRPVDLDGWDNTTFRLGDDMSMRLPSHEQYVPQIAKEHRWLPLLRGHLPFPIPRPITRGAPGCGYPHPWSVYRWLNGDPAALAGVRDLDRFAADIATFLAALHRAPVDHGPPPGPHSFGRGGPVTVWDEQTRGAILRLGDRIDTGGALAVWEAAVDAPPWPGPDVWVHGDVVPSNLLVRDDRLCGVIDFGCSAVGDPACDLTMAWTVFEGSSRRRFTDAVSVDPGTWARARGWALWKAVVALPTLPETDPRNDGTRFGWRWPATGVVEQIIEEFRA